MECSSSELKILIILQKIEKLKFCGSGRSQIWDLIMKRKILNEIDKPRRTHPKGPRRTQSTVLMAVRHGSVRH